MQLLNYPEHTTVNTHQNSYYDEIRENKMF